MPALSERFQCRHILADGHRCGSPALREENFCFYHHTTRRPPAPYANSALSPAPEAFSLPVPEDRTSIQLSIGEVLNRIAQGTLNHRTAGLLLYGLQIASNNLPRRRDLPAASDSNLSTLVEEVVTHPSLGLLAPQSDFADAPRPHTAMDTCNELLREVEEIVRRSEALPPRDPDPDPLWRFEASAGPAPDLPETPALRFRSRPKCRRLKTFGPRSRGATPSPNPPSRQQRKLAPMPNPYAANLAGQNARAVLASTPGLLHQAACSLTPEQIEAPIAPGKWSPRQIVAHLADCEIAFSFRLRQTLAGPGEGASHVTLQPFDQDAWARHYANYDLPSALTAFHALREWNLKLTGGLSKAELASAATHPERGPLTFQSILETMAGHDLNHLTQLQRVAQPSSS